LINNEEPYDHKNLCSECGKEYKTMIQTFLTPYITAGTYILVLLIFVLLWMWVLEHGLSGRGGAGFVLLHLIGILTLNKVWVSISDKESRCRCQKRGIELSDDNKKNSRRFFGGLATIFYLGAFNEYSRELTVISSRTSFRALEVIFGSHVFFMLFILLGSLCVMLLLLNEKSK